MTALNQNIHSACVANLSAVGLSETQFQVQAPIMAQVPAQTQQAATSYSPSGIIKLWFARARQRRELAELPAHLLKDIGICEAQRQQEISKPFWR